MGGRGEPAKETSRPNFTWRKSPMANLDEQGIINQGHKQIAKEIMIAYITQLKTPISLFDSTYPKEGHFEAVWGHILKTVSAQG